MLAIPGAVLDWEWTLVIWFGNRVDVRTVVMVIRRNKSRKNSRIRA